MCYIIPFRHNVEDIGLNAIPDVIPMFQLFEPKSGWITELVYFIFVSGLYKSSILHIVHKKIVYHSYIGKLSLKSHA